MSDKEKSGLWSRKWVRWVTAIGVILVLMALSVIVWHKPLVNARAHKKAQELYDLATSRGYKVPPVADLANLYGADGGATAVTADDDIARALLSQNVNRSGEVNQRPGIIDRRLLEFEYLVLKVYRPAEAAKYKKYIDGLKSEKTISP